MVTDAQVRRLMKLIHRERTFALAAAKAGMDEKTARRYRDAGKLSSQLAAGHTWRTRPDLFEEVWDAVQEKLELNPGLEAKTLFEDLQRRYPGRFQNGQVRTLQRRIKIWRALEGPGREVYFPQVYEPGQSCQSDFTDLSGLGVTLQRQPFDHLAYHFVLAYSNWETATICFSESFESLSEGLQNSLWELGGVPRGHQTDCLSAALQKLDDRQDFTARYQALLRHYHLEGRKTNPASPHENGVVEQRHRRFRNALDQALMLRGHRDFENRAQYAAFVKKVLDQLNAGRKHRLSEELALLKELPLQRMEDCKRLRVGVSSFSTIRVNHNTYSVHSRLRGETVDVRLYADHLDVYYAQRRLERYPRLRGKGGHRVHYRHVIDWLVRKPGAFEGYRYREDLFPTTRFRMTYDTLYSQHASRTASKEYLRILHLATYEGEARVDTVLGRLLDRKDNLSAARVEASVRASRQSEAQAGVPQVFVAVVDLRLYDSLLPSHHLLAEVAG